MAHPIRPESYISMDNFYTSTVYDKGAEIIRMYHTLLGDDGFKKGMDLYFERHDGSAVTCDDFRAAMADANAADLEQFGLWYSQAGTPEVQLTTQWNAATSEFSILCEQSYPDHPYDVPGAKNRIPVPIPIVVGLLGSDGHDLPLDLNGTPCSEKSCLLELKSAKQTFVFQDLSEKPVLSALRNFSAPVRLKMERSRRELAFLMSHDSDSFNRWEASQVLATQVLMGLIDNLQSDLPMHVDPVFVEAYGNLLVDTSLDGSFKALLMNLPQRNRVGTGHERRRSGCHPSRSSILNVSFGIHLSKPHARHLP